MREFRTSGSAGGPGQAIASVYPTGEIAFPRVLAVAGEADRPELAYEAAVVGLDVLGNTLQWSDLTFVQPIASETSGVYMVFELPLDGAFETEGVGAGVGYIEGDGEIRSWIAIDENYWHRLSPDYQMAVEPVMNTNKSAEVLVLGSPVSGMLAAASADPPPVELVASMSVAPNPFNPSTEISFTLPARGDVKLTVYDVRGRLVRTLVDGRMEAGQHAVTWLGRDNGGRQQASGVYLALLRSGSVRMTRTAHADSVSDDQPGGGQARPQPTRGATMPSHRTTMILLLTLTVLVGTSVQARTWTVERDGSGEFAIIQNAVNTAASGDTILIGPGRYDEGEVYTNPGWSEYVRVVVTQEELTLIGSGEETIIGQEEIWELDQGFHKGIFASQYYGNQVIRLIGIRFENNGDGVLTEDVDVTMSSCSFVHNVHSFGAIGRNRVEVEDCVFTNLERDGVHFAAFFSEYLSVRRCTFTLWAYHPWNQVHFNSTGVQNLLIEECEFFEGAAGAVLGISSVGEIRNCLFDGQSMIGANTGPGSDLTLTNCTFRNQYCVSNLYNSDSRLVARNCVIEDATLCSVRVASVESLSFQDCDLAHGELGAVWVDDCTETPPQHLDFTNNYWGTDDPDSIQAWIRDQNDGDGACRIVDYEPYRVHSTPVEETSLSDLKALFGGGRE